MAEAEYAVALYMYMRLQGYPPDKITILTTYNGQKHLIRDVLNKRCGSNQYFGNPEKVGEHLLEIAVYIVIRLLLWIVTKAPRMIISYCH